MKSIFSKYFGKLFANKLLTRERLSIAKSTGDIAFRIEKNESSCTIYCNDLRATAIGEFIKRLGFSFGKQFDYGENNLVRERFDALLNVRRESFVLEHWKCSMVYGGDDVGYATFSNDSRVDIVTIGSIVITCKNSNADVIQRLIKDLVSSFEALQAHLNK
jgi:hypothetical protein